MESNNKTLTNLWVDDGAQGTTVKTIFPSQLASSGSLQPPHDILKFYQDQGFDSMAKEAGIIETTEELLSIGAAASAPPPKSKTIKLIAVPVSSTQKNNNPPFKVLPRTVYVSGPSTPLHIAPQPPQATFVSLPTTAVMHHQQSQQHKQQVLPKVIQLITTPTYSPTSAVQQPQHQLHGQPIWTVSKRPSAVVPPPTTGASAMQSAETGDYYDSKRRKSAHGGKGLRHFAMKVCEKVQKKGVTSYNEVADELVNEFTDPNCDLLTSEQQFDQKNIRRRVYDALNVLMAMNIISKEKKEIRWIGLPTNSAQECQNLEVEKQRILERIQQKTQQLNELILQQIAFKNLVQRNKSVEQQSNGLGPVEGSTIQLPFILVNTSKKTIIDCSISSDKYEYLFNFDQTFEIHDDIEVLKRMGMAFGLEKGQCSQADLNKAVKMVPKALESYVYALANANNTNMPHVAIKVEPGTRAASNSRNADHMLDVEVAMTTGHSLLSRQSSFGSVSDLQSTVRDSPDYSDNSESDDD